MDVYRPDGPLCQSCGMPMRNEEDYGTDAQGKMVSEYCHFCYHDGEFTEPGITMEEMMDRVVDVMVKRLGMQETRARSVAETFIPRLKRWKTQK